MPVVQSEVPHPIRASSSQYRMTVVQSEVHTQFGPVGRKINTGRDGGKKSDGAAEELVADVMRRVIPGRH